VTYRIERTVEGDAVVFVLSGELDAEQAAKLRDLIASEDVTRVRLDLKDVTRVDPTGLSFLAQIDGAGITLVHCAEYLRHWMAAEGRRR
jgi:anti-anti-sigma factor